MYYYVDKMPDSEQKRCGDDCKYWDRDIYEEYDSGWGLCEKLKKNTQEYDICVFDETDIEE